MSVLLPVHQSTIPESGASRLEAGKSLFAPANPKPRAPKLRSVPEPRIPARERAERLDPKSQVTLHPKGCRCSFHAFGRPWGIPRSAGKAIPLMQGRRVVLYDVENQQGSPNASALQVAQAFRFTRSVLSLTREDYVIFGMSHFTAGRCSFALPINQTALVLKSGPSGADLALIVAADLEKLTQHYSSLVVVSNDHIFAQLAKKAKGLGMSTWNVSSDLAKISDETRAAYDGWTHLKLSAIQKNQRERSRARRESRARTATAAPSGPRS